MHQRWRRRLSPVTSGDGVEAGVGAHPDAWLFCCDEGASAWPDECRWHENDWRVGPVCDGLDFGRRDALPALRWLERRVRHRDSTRWGPWCEVRPPAE